MTAHVSWWYPPSAVRQQNSRPSKWTGLVGSGRPGLHCNQTAFSTTRQLYFSAGASLSKYVVVYTNPVIFWRQLIDSERQERVQRWWTDLSIRALGQFVRGRNVTYTCKQCKPLSTSAVLQATESRVGGEQLYTNGEHTLHTSHESLHHHLPCQPDRLHPH